jgi:hypothetical protein
MNTRHNQRFMQLKEYRAIMDNIYKNKSPLKIPTSRDNSNNRKEFLDKTKFDENKEECLTGRTLNRNKSDLNDIKSLLACYNDSSEVDKSRNITPIKFNRKTSKQQIEKIQSFLKNKNHIELTTIDKTYDNPISSFRDLQSNKQLCSKINDIVLSNQVDKYSKMIENFEKYKMNKMRVRCSSIDQVLNKMKLKDESEHVYSKRVREDYFMKNNTLMTRYSRNKNPPQARSESSMIGKRINGNNYLFLFGGLGANRYNDISFCDISMSF